MIDSLSPQSLAIIAVVGSAFGIPYFWLVVRSAYRDRRKQPPLLTTMATLATLIIIWLSLLVDKSAAEANSLLIRMAAGFIVVGFWAWVEYLTRKESQD